MHASVIFFPILLFCFIRIVKKWVNAWKRELGKYIRMSVEQARRYQRFLGVACALYWRKGDGQVIEKESWVREVGCLYRVPYIF